MSIDTVVSYFERRVSARSRWQWRLLGYTVGLLRIVDWSSSKHVFNRHASGTPFRLGVRLNIAMFMWSARYLVRWNGGEE